MKIKKTLKIIASVIVLISCGVGTSIIGSEIGGIIGKRLAEWVNS